ncbi:hypothetical protein AUEXF2481DRAFT_253699 [Aureobasidium subglaciale EXF-2481]|uniref:Uncharacterized protein n=1 Tax=Aureobasidium subglaciale (strain EXF-2481) TaxID=1043005 RepID=A0A074YF93_AURSE|nr:uncharacterized protein AUEXF2481DRAFT_253699 [Aureobasidium subglaciale EXF-2481]KEQ94709.1 hypothetical protein AUEXF2481DRAFT_253699 [Aureobasidium subglaciale EXF-2481]
MALGYDFQNHTGWLVPQISLLLHLCHAYFARLSNLRAQADPIPCARPSTDVALNSNLQVTRDTKQAPKKKHGLTKEIHFSELQDQILEPGDGSALRVLAPSDCPSIKAWSEITQKVDGLLVCRNLDQAIKLAGPCCYPRTTTTPSPQPSNGQPIPAPSSMQTFCSSCVRVPEGQGYLVAHTWCLQNVLGRTSPVPGKDMATWIRNGKPFDPILHDANESIWAHPEKVLQ